MPTPIHIVKPITRAPATIAYANVTVAHAASTVLPTYKPLALASSVGLGSWVVAKSLAYRERPMPKAVVHVSVPGHSLYLDSSTKTAYYVSTEPRLVDVDVTVQRDQGEGGEETVGGTAVLSFSVVPEFTGEEWEEVQERWRTATVEAGQGAKWTFRPVDLSRLSARLDTDSRHLAGDAVVTANPDTGSAVVLLRLTDLGAMAWRQAFASGDASSLVGGVTMRGRFLVGSGTDVRTEPVVATATLGGLLAGAGPDDLTETAREHSVKATVRVVGHPTMETVAVELRPRGGGSVETSVLASDGGTVAIELAGDDLGSVVVDWTARVVFGPLDWPPVELSGRLSHADGWVALVDPSSWATRVTLLALLLGEDGTVLPPDATDDPENRVVGHLRFRAPYLANELTAGFETSGQQQVVIEFPRPPREPAGEIELTVHALRGGRPFLAARILDDDDSLVISEVLADGTIHIRTNTDALDEEDGDLGQLITLVADGPPGRTSDEEDLRPLILGPDSADRDGPPPSFDVFTGPNPFYEIEIASDPAILVDAGVNGGTYYSSVADTGALSTDPTFTLPLEAWTQLRVEDRLYYRVWTSADDLDWVDFEVSVPDEEPWAIPSIELTSPASPTPSTAVSADLGPIARYLSVSEDDLHADLDRYLRGLGALLAHHGTIGHAGDLDASNVRDVVARFQAEIGLDDDGVPGEQTLWALNSRWARTRNLGRDDVEVDRWEPDHLPANQHGLRQFRLREDAATAYEDLRRDVLDAGGVITSAGSFRRLDANVTPGRSQTSFHYSGLALDLAPSSGMHRPHDEPYVITREGSRRWRVWVAADQGDLRTLDAIVARAGSTRTESVTRRVLDFTELAARHGFRSIGQRSCFPGNYMCSEWWHFQFEQALTPWVSQFGAELLSLREYREADLQVHGDVWSQRRRIFRRGRNGWR